MSDDQEIVQRGNPRTVTPAMIRFVAELFDACQVAAAFLEDNYRDDVNGIPMYETMPEWQEIKGVLAAILKEEDA
jgi:hypothetical protein